MEKIVSEWNDLKILDKILEKKLVFIETKDIQETHTALKVRVLVFIVLIETKGIHRTQGGNAG